MASQLILIVLVALITVNGFVPIGTAGNTVSALLVLLSVILGAWEAFHAVVLTLLLRVAPSLLPESVLNLPATTFLIPFLVSIALIWPTPRARSTLSWMRSGTIDRVTLVLILVTSGISTLTLLGWAAWTDYLGIGAQMMSGVLRYSCWLVLLVLIPLFALINAAAEELVYRGVLQQALQLTFGSPLPVILLQASAFAAAHVAIGFPNGVLGYFMVFIYGSTLGYLRQRTRGLLAPYLTHVLADLTIGYYLYYHAVKFG